MKLTGIMETGALEPGRSSRHGTMIGPQLYAPYHQHIFCFRLDLDIDGTSNSVFEVDMRPEPLGPGNLYGNAWRAVPTLLRRESEAQRLTDASAARTWKVVNPDVLNEFGDPVGYRGSFVECRATCGVREQAPVGDAVRARRAARSR